MRGSFWNSANVLELVVMVAQLCDYTKIHQLVYFKRVNVMTCEIYLKTKIQPDQTECLIFPQNSLLWCPHPEGRRHTCPNPQAHSLDMAPSLSCPHSLHPSILPISPWLSSKNPEGFLWGG